MRAALAILGVVLTLATRNAALAAPTAYYNPADGSIRLKNDTGSSKFLVILYSPSGKFTGIPLSIPGTTHEFGVQHNYLAYFSLPTTTSDPSTWWNVGAVVPGGGPLATLDLYGGYLVTPTDIERPISWIEIPEPTSALLGGLSIAVLVAARRRRRAHFVASAPRPFFTAAEHVNWQRSAQDGVSPRRLIERRMSCV